MFCRLTPPTFPLAFSIWWGLRLLIGNGTFCSCLFIVHLPFKITMPAITTLTAMFFIQPRCSCCWISVSFYFSRFIRKGFDLPYPHLRPCRSIYFPPANYRSPSLPVSLDSFLPILHSFSPPQSVSSASPHTPPPVSVLLSSTGPSRQLSETRTNPFPPFQSAPSPSNISSCLWLYSQTFSPKSPCCSSLHPSTRSLCRMHASKNTSRFGTRSASKSTYSILLYRISP